MGPMDEAFDFYGTSKLKGVDLPPILPSSKTFFGETVYSFSAVPSSSAFYSSNASLLSSFGRLNESFEQSGFIGTRSLTSFFFCHILFTTKR